jgi:hypothetical protein
MEDSVKTILQQALESRVTLYLTANKQHNAKPHSRHLGKIILSKLTFLCFVETN